MTLIVEIGDPHHPEATALLRESHALMQSLFPPEDNYYLEVSDLVAPHIHFFTARKDGKIIGTGALKVTETYGEVKSMYVSQEARGTGAADALLRAIEDQARVETLLALKLETGNTLYAAHKLYARHGFTECGVFGDYVTANSSIFMEKIL